MRARVEKLYVLGWNKSMIIIFMDVFIIINYSDFDDFLSVNKILYKGTKQGMLNHYILLWG